MTLVDVRPGLLELLASNAGIKAMVDGRIYPVKVLQGVSRDSLVYNLISEFDIYKMDGPSGLVSARYQIDAWSQSADSAMTLANLVKEQLGGFAGLITLDPPLGTVNVQGIFSVTGRDDWDEGVLMYRVSRDYYVWYAERNA
jgi:hypothetical protein